MYKNILIPIVYDPDTTPDLALSAARNLRDENASVTLLHVIEELPNYAASYVAVDYIEQSRKEVTARIKAVANLIEGGKAVVVHGHSARTILSYAEDNGVDCIIVSSHKPGVQDYFLGGTAARVVRYAQCAVHVIR
ncbi:MAG: universal stress protein [Pseudomonadota bacterium]